MSIRVAISHVCSLRYQARLVRCHYDLLPVSLNVQFALNHDNDLIELGNLIRLTPRRRSEPMRQTESVLLRIEDAKMFVNDLSIFTRKNTPVLYFSQHNLLTFLQFLT